MVPGRDPRRLQPSRHRPGRPPGKLRAAARALAFIWTGQADPERVSALDVETRAQFALLGVAAADLPGGDVAPDETVEVWDDHWHAFTIFRACISQWRVVATQQRLHYLGLDYAGVDVVIRRLLPADVDAGAVFADLMVMEAAALPVLGEASS